jgi:hypothetical protein
VNQQGRTLLLLGAVTVLAGAAGLYAWYGIEKKDEHEARAKDVNERLFAPTKLDEKGTDGGIPKAEFLKITVANGSETTVLTRVPGEEWKIASPLQTAADKIAVDQVVSQLQLAKLKQVVDATPDDAALERYGLKPPRFVVTAEAEVGDAHEKRTVKLEGGIENTFDGTVYLRREGSPQIWSAEGGVRWTLQKSLYDLRDKTVFDIDESKCTRFEVKTKVNAYAIERAPDKAWRIVKPFESGADQSSLTGLFGALKQERAISFPPDSAEARKHFEEPELDATFTLEGNAVVRFRAARVEGKTWVLREEGPAAVLAEISEKGAGQLDRNPKDLKDRLILSFHKEQVAKILFHQADGSEQVVEKARGADGGLGDSWSVTAPKAGPAKTFKVAAVLWTLGAMKASVFGDESPKDWSKFGIDNKSRAVTLFGADGAVLAKLQIGKDVPAKVTTTWFRGTRNQVIEGDNSRLTELPTSVDDLLDQPAADAGKK